ncbi:GntR family transcriptional regulator [Anianabacter salinae]|uniref:GntR family transcriptional regulator n=1 Tax=Anianabacter salinae TaxID=2851023 RepID=UPI00225DE252|nr:GntR family transcriptional regulator [Anianabacter salinae]MBV0912404.1 GntR family transcriptional regulator [Anianabacter salinae]
MDVRRADHILDNLEQMIVTGSFAHGERLDEIRLSEQFGVSRTPIREALQKLVASGLVEQRPRRGVFVIEPGPVELVEMFEAMAELEASCGYLAAKRITEANLQALQDVNELCKRAVAAPDADKYYAHNEKFHHLIYEAAQSSYLRDLALRLQKRLKPYRRLQLHLRGRLEQSMAEHEAILRALADGDSKRTADELRGHVAVQGEKFHHLLSHLKSKR